MKKIVKVFAIRSVICLVLWLIIYDGLIVPDGRLNDLLTTKVLEGTFVGLNALGFDALVDGRSIYIDGQPAVSVADACNGLELIALYAGFIICFPGPWKYKALFVFFGSILVFMINVVREVVLALNYKFFNETFELNHKYTYVLVVYSLVFLIWRFWLRKYSIIGSNGAVSET